MSPIEGSGAIARIAGGQTAGQAARLRTLREMEPQRGITLEPPSSAQTSFSDTLAAALAEVNDLQLRSGEMLERFAAGQVQDLHEVVIAQQEAAIAFRLVQEVRDKLLQGYQDIMRMQV
jgi:flagellar hook-basal body complex protein FliE